MGTHHDGWTQCILCLGVRPMQEWVGEGGGFAACLYLCGWLQCV